LWSTSGIPQLMQPVIVVVFPPLVDNNCGYATLRKMKNNSGSYSLICSNALSFLVEKLRTYALQVSV